MKDSQKKEGDYFAQPATTAWELLMYHPESPLEDIYNLHALLFTAYKALGSNGDSHLDDNEIAHICRTVEYGAYLADEIAGKMNTWGAEVPMKRAEVRVSEEGRIREFVVVAG